MIKINLLPTKRKPTRKVTELQKQLILAVLIFGGVAAGMAFYYIALTQKISQRQQERDTDQKKVADQDNLLKEVKNVEAERKMVTDEIAIIEQLKKNQQGPVRLLDEVSRALPNGVNISSFVEASGSVSLAGDAFTNEDVVRFIDNLKRSPYFTDVFLQETSLALAEGIEFYKYKLQFKYKGI
jgi:type IV pilus assembly protein PilN